MVRGERPQYAPIPPHIMQMGPPYRATWAAKFNHSFGSWQRHHPNWTYTLLAAGLQDNRNLERIVSRHAPHFLSTWRRLCYGIMQIDLARVVWLYAHGGVYADLDVEARESAAPHLEGAAVVLVANDTNHAKERCELRQPNCGTHMSNYFMAGVAGHPFWLALLNYTTRHVGRLCREHSARNLVHRVPELTGPFAVGRTYEAMMASATPAVAQSIRVLPRRVSFMQSHSEGSWLKRVPDRINRGMVPSNGRRGGTVPSSLTRTLAAPRVPRTVSAI